MVIAPSDSATEQPMCPLAHLSLFLVQQLTPFRSLMAKHLSFFQAKSLISNIFRFAENVGKESNNYRHF